MYKTIQIFRGLLSITSYNRVIISKYCVSHKGGKDSGEKDCTPSETRQKSAAEKNEISENEIISERMKREEGINSSSDNEFTTPNESVKSANFKSVKKMEPVKNKVESGVSSVENSTSVNEEFQKKKLNQLIQMAEIDTDSKSDSNLNSELHSFKERFESEKSEHEVGDKNYSFASLLRKSAFIDLGDPVNKLVIGEIYLTVGNDLYIDFGWKFPAICPRPKVNPQIYNIGAKVLLRIKDLELTAKFLGDKEYTSLLEADCDLIHRINEDGSQYVIPTAEKNLLT